MQQCNNQELNEQPLAMIVTPYSQNAAAKLTYKAISEVFNLPWHEAVLKLSVSEKELRAACKRWNIARWPYKNRNHERQNRYTRNGSMFRTFYGHNLKEEPFLKFIDYSFPAQELELSSFKNVQSFQPHQPAITQTSNEMQLQHHEHTNEQQASSPTARSKKLDLAYILNKK